MAARELLKLWARPPTVSPSARRSSLRERPRGASARRRPRSRAQLRMESTDRSISTLVRRIWRAMSWISSWSAKRSASAAASRGSRRIHRPTCCRTRLIMRSGLKVHQLGHPLAMMGGVAERELRALRALEVEVQVVLPGEADAAVELDTRRGHAPEGVGDVGLGHADREWSLRRVLVECPRRVVGDGLAVLHVHQHVGRAVLDALVGADRAAEGLADLRVLDRHVEHLLGPPAHLGAE